MFCAQSLSQSSVIADKLGIPRSAAKERAERLYQRLGVHSRDEAVSRARALGLLRRYTFPRRGIASAVMRGGKGQLPQSRPSAMVQNWPICAIRPAVSRMRRRTRNRRSGAPPGSGVR
jgi:hypothetical protein